MAPPKKGAIFLGAAMIDLNIKLSDIGSPIVPTDTGIRIGASYVDFYIHRMIVGAVYFNDRRILVIARELAIADGYDGLPITVHNNISDKAMDELNNNSRRTALAALVIEINRDYRYPHVNIYNNHNPQSFLYFCVQDREINGSWNLMKIARRVNRNIVCDEFLSKWITLQPQQYNNTTMFKNIYRTTINTDTLITADRVRIAELDCRDSTYPRRLQREDRAKEILFEILTECLTQRPLAEGKTAAEVSGGLDSSVVALAASAVLTSTIAASVNITTDKNNQTSRQRLVADTLALNHVNVSIWDHLPFARSGARFCTQDTSYLAESFFEAFYHLTAILRRRGVDTILTGMGGDEAFPLFAGEADTSSGVKPIVRPSFIEPKAYLLAALPYVTRSFISSYHGSCAHSVTNRAERFMNQGIWSVNPFAEPAMIQFGSSLPYAQRSRRSILSDILSGNNMPEFLDHKPTSFEPTLKVVAREVEGILSSVWKNSICAQRGLINTSCMRKIYDELISEDGSSDEELAYFAHILFFLQAELFLRVCESSGIKLVYSG
ncbi:asparagine synthase-related protein [Segnochrobactrum spirostomi]|uniref:Asparagine synthetase domain-containing protein n=1 Tax=Segnochrobactrum spirostomi TaxID=2608987 RepID=A0A6A7Y2W2_9HYPH|nr:asparagine synthase-related protein [Segnochrobactrum spirostomi]MQT13086.1 hypothetical protein [Segnochrobactrum spirostomi]